MSRCLLGTEFVATLGGLWARAQKLIFMNIKEFSRISSTSCEIFLEI